MAEDSSRERDEQKRVQRTERHSEHSSRVSAIAESASLPASVPAYSGSLLINPSLGGRGNGPVKVAVMQQMQGAYGNRAVQRFMRQQAAVQRAAQVPGAALLTPVSPALPQVAPYEVAEAAQEKSPSRQATQAAQAIPSVTPVAAKPQAVQRSAPARMQARKQSRAPVQRGFWSAVGDFVGGLGQKAFEAAVRVAGGDKLLNLLKRAGSAMGNIISDPGKFLRSLIAGVKGGFERFAQNIGSHLQRGLKEWLFGQLGKTNLQLPQSFDAAGIFSLVMQVLGLTKDRIREKLVKLVGAREVQVIEGAWKGLTTLMQKGVGGMWEEIKEHLSDLKDVVLDEIKGWVITRVVQAAVIKIISMFNPASGLVAVLDMVWKVIQFVMERMSQLTALGTAVMDSMAAIASGNVGGVISKIEDVLSRGMSVVIGLLANLVGLGGIGTKIRDIMTKVRTKVEGALDKVIKKIADKVKAGLKRITGGGSDKGAQQPAPGTPATQPGSALRPVEKSFSMKGASHTLYVTPGAAAQVEMASKRDLLSNKVGRAVSKLMAQNPSPDARTSKQIEDLKRIGGEAKKLQKIAKDVGADRTALSQLPQFVTNVVGLITIYGDTYQTNDIEAMLSGKDSEALTKGSIALYRGAHFKSTLNQEDYDRKLIENLVGQPEFSKAALEITGSTRRDATDVSRADKVAAAQLVQEEVKRTRSTGTVRQWWGDKKQQFDSLFLAMLQRYINTYDAFGKEISAMERGKYEGLAFHKIPFLSTSKRAIHAASYATGEKFMGPADQKRTAGIVGRLFVYVFKLRELKEQGAVDVSAAHAAGQIKVNSRILNEGEVTFTGQVPGENLVAQHDAHAGQGSVRLASQGEQSARQKAGEGGLLKW
jgi:hypothetical protein